MSCEVEKLNGVIHISGELTIYSAAVLKDGLFAALGEEADECRVDVSQVSEVDTSGLQLLIMMRRLCAAAAREFTLLDPSDALREVLELLKLDCRLRSDAVATPAGGAA
jgi:anti-sigma B factor antagonist